MLPVSIDFRITPRCNMCCPFCFGTKNKKMVDLAHQIEFLEKLWQVGVKNVVITGGEPTLEPEFPELLESLSNIGYTIALSTNGTFWERHDLRDAVLRYITCISLPLEADNQDIHNRLRKGIPDHYQLVHRILRDIYTDRLDLQVKIGTVVTEINADHLTGVLDEVLLNPVVWKLYQLSRCSYNSEFYKRYHVSDERFQYYVRNLKTMYFSRPTKIIGAYEQDRDGKYLFLEPNGDLMTIIGNREVVIGSISDTEDVLYSNIEESVDSDKVASNFQESFAIGDLWTDTIQLKHGTLT